MRCVLAIALLFAFTSPLVLPLFAATADPDASLPACCRRHGKHRCSMSAAMIAMIAASSGPAFIAPLCPLYPGAIPPVRIAPVYFETPRTTSVELRRDPAPNAPISLRIRLISHPSQSTRGPPLRLA